MSAVAKCGMCGVETPNPNQHLVNPHCVQEFKKQISELRESLAQLTRRHEANLMCWEVREREFVVRREAAMIDENNKLKDLLAAKIVATAG